MSKLYNIYLSLKSKDKTNILEKEKYLYLFKSGIFYICIDEDANIASSLLHLKLTKLNDTVVKCGFPINSLEKYSKLLSFTSYHFKIIDPDKNEIFTIKDYSTDDKIQKLLLKISNVNIDNLSVREAYDFIDNLKKFVKTI